MLVCCVICRGNYAFPDTSWYELLCSISNQESPPEACLLTYTVRLARPVTKIRPPAGTPHASGAKPGYRCETRAYKLGFI